MSWAEAGLSVARGGLTPLWLPRTLPFPCACLLISQLLEELAGKWADHQVTMNMVRDILMYMVSENAR